MGVRGTRGVGNLCVAIFWGNLEEIVVRCVRFLGGGILRSG